MGIRLEGTRGGYATKANALTSIQVTVLFLSQRASRRWIDRIGFAEHESLRALDVPRE